MVFNHPRREIKIIFFIINLEWVMYKAFLETVHNHADKVAINVVYNRPETPKALKRRREGKKRKAEDRTFFPSPKELTWGQLGKMVKECQEAITQAISGSRSQLRSSRGTVLFCACSGNFRLLVSWLAALGTGNTPVFVNPFSTQQQFEKVITETGPLVIFIETRVVNIKRGEHTLFSHRIVFFL